MKRLLCLLLCCCTVFSLLTGCQSSDEPYVPTGDGLTWDDEDPNAAATQPPASEAQELTLIYYPDITLNPLRCTDFTNKAILSLMYQGLFTVDRDYNVEPMLCSRYTMSESMRTYTFYLDEKAAFSDGEKVTPEDVVATLKFAKSNGVYRSRFNKVSSISVGEDGGVVMKLSTAYENFPLLLDVPILKEEELELDLPLGSGPYVFTDYGMGAQLTRQNRWWCNAPDMVITAPVIRLVEAESVNQIRDEFQFGDLDLVQANTGSDRYADYLCDYELWDSENGVFLYLAFNQNSDYFDDADVRAAITYGINRDMIVSDYYKGFARSASLPASPMCPYYNTSLASRYDYDPVAFVTAVQNVSLDGKTLVMIVNGKDSHRVRVANAIKDMLAAAGITVKIQTYSGGDYSYALRNLEYDMYLGQTILSPNMDLSHFFSSSGNLNYGGIDDITAYTLCQQALENHGNYYTLHQTVMEEGLICPILFASYAIYATRGLLTELTPARDNVFYYSIGRTMEEAFIRE